MSLAVRPPSRSVLGVEWCEDFARGRLGVSKNQGAISGTLGIDGCWGRFDGSTTRITYPHIIMRCTGLTYGIKYRNLDPSTSWKWIMSQYISAGNREFGFNFKPSTGDLYAYMIISGTQRSAHITSTSLITGEHSLIATWESGDQIRLYDGEDEIASSGPYAGSIDDAGIALTVGAAYGGGGEIGAEFAKPFVNCRGWSAAEVKGYTRRSLFC